MKDAKSMYLGGDIVNADECDFDSYKKLGLVCPFCNEAVFLRAGFIGKRGSKSVDIPACFSHFPASRETVEDCERRSQSKEGRAAIERIKAEARNQRLEIYNRYLWEMISVGSLIGVSEDIDHKTLGDKTKRTLSRFFKKKEIQKLYDGFCIDYKRALPQIEQQIAAHSDFLFAEASTKYPIAKVDIVYKRKSEVLNETSSLSFHRNICREVVFFLATKTAGYTFRHVFYQALLHSVALKQQPTLANLFTKTGSLIAQVPWEMLINKYSARS